MPRRSADGRLVYALIAFHYPPSTQVAAVRAWGLARELAEAGDEVHVFTPVADGPTRPGVTVHVVAGSQTGDGVKTALGLPPGASLRHGVPRALAPIASAAVRLGKEIALFPDGARSWADACARALESWLEASPCDVLISTASPVSAHLAAMRLRSRHPELVWISDWRDLWTANPFYNSGRIRRSRDLRLERLLVANADGHVATTRQMAAILQEQYPGANVRAIYNGFDEASYRSNSPKQAGTAPLTLTHAGALYEGNCSTLPLLRAVADLMAEGLVARDRLRLEFAGPPDAVLQEGVSLLGLDDVVHLHGVLPRTKAHELMRDSDVLFVISASRIGSTSVVPAKTFEYIEARRPVLALNCGHSSELGMLLEKTRTGTCARSDHEVREAVLRLYHEFEESGRIAFDPDVRELAQFTHAHMARSFDDFARELRDARPDHEPDATGGRASRRRPS